MTYFDEGPGWAICWKVDTGKCVCHGVMHKCRILSTNDFSMIPFPISDSIWLENGSLLVGAGHQMCLFGQPRPNSKGVAPSSPWESLFELVARQNGPLQDYHPQMLLQCLLWGAHFSLCTAERQPTTIYRQSGTGEGNHREPCS